MLSISILDYQFLALYTASYFFDLSHQTARCSLADRCLYSQGPYQFNNQTGWTSSRASLLLVNYQSCCFHRPKAILTIRTTLSFHWKSAFPFIRTNWNRLFQRILCTMLNRIWLSTIDSGAKKIILKVYNNLLDQNFGSDELNTHLWRIVEVGFVLLE